MEVNVLIKPVVNLLLDGRINIGSRYDFGRIVTFAVDDRGEIYMVYRVQDVDELIRLHERVASRPQRLQPIEVEVEIPPNPIHFLAGAKPKTIKIPAREIPTDLVTKENLRDVLIKNAKPTMLTWGLAMLLVAPYATANILLCDEAGIIEIKGGYADYCRIGGRVFVRPPGLLWYEVPPEVWQKVSKHISLKIEEMCVGEIEPLRAELGLEVEPETLAKYIAQRLSITGEYIGRASEVRYLTNEERLYCGYAKYSSAYAAKPQSGRLIFGKFDVICVRGGCYAWKAGEFDADAPDEAVIDCLENEACDPAFVDTMPEPRRSRLYDLLERRLQWYFEHEWGPGVVRRFPLEVVKRVLGPVESYEEAEKKWEQMLEERERKREEEARLARQYMEEKKKEVAEEVSKLLEGWPVKVAIDKYVYIRPTRKLTEEEKRKINEMVRPYGFRYNPRGLWIYKLL